jgi:cation/acetate symporter
MTIGIFLTFVASVLGLSFYFGRRVKSAGGYYAAGGQIHWSVNGIAFAGDYLSAASFLGICGMIATAGYDGFLYSIGYLAGWVVALFVVAEPLKRMGRYTLTDALDLKFDSRAIKLTAAIGTLIISVCYLIPQMVGAGVLIEPLLNLPHYVGVIMVGAIVITIVATAGMTSTTYVQFLKGALLIVFSLILVVAVCVRGISTTPDQGGAVPFHEYQTVQVADLGGSSVGDPVVMGEREFVKVVTGGSVSWWLQIEAGTLREIQWETRTADGRKLVNGEPEIRGVNDLRQVGGVVQLAGRSGPEAETGPISPLRMISLLADRETLVQIWKTARITDGGDAVTLHYPTIVPGNKLMRPGMLFKVEGTPLEKLDFVSLMLALFLGTAALPHILIRYYTVPSPAAARKSTIVAIAAIGTFYVLTLFMGLGAMLNQTINPLTDNMSAPLLARSFGTFLFAAISAIAFATVLGTVAGLIVAASGAVAHDVMDRFAGLRMTEKAKVRAGKVAAIVVGIIAIILGILFQGMNVSFLVGLAFAIAASANLPAILGVIFWRKTTWQGISASMVVGITSAIVLILLSPTMYPRFGLPADAAPFPLMNPGIVSIPLSFITFIGVSLWTWKDRSQSAERLEQPGELVAAGS